MIKNDNSFVCQNCGKDVPPLKYTSRNHCPYCLHSIHIDNVPGDRANTCLGIMEPIDVEPSSKKGYIITFRCTKCKEVKRNKMADDDDYDTLLKMTRKGFWQINQ
ncbi:MAG: RNHCP domain-containing protein [Clostridia bacterium]|nr:RNHCP domain-containing protein [Clostridia bacterium]